MIIILEKTFKSGEICNKILEYIIEEINNVDSDDLENMESVSLNLFK